MKSLSIIAIALFALLAVSSSLPITSEQPEAENDLAARVDALQFLYDNILQQLFSGIVTNAGNLAVDSLNNLLGSISKREATDDLAARVDALQFLYDNILQQLLSGIVTNAGNLAVDSLNNLLGSIGKREANDDLAARVDALQFLYDNILQQLLSGIVTNAGNLAVDSLNNLLGSIGKRDANDDLAARVNIFQFMYENLFQDLFTGIVTNAGNLVVGTLNNLIETNPLGIGKRSVDIQQAQTIIAQTVSTLTQKFKTFAKQAVSLWNDRQKLNQLVQDNVADIKATIHQLAQQLSHLIPTTITNEISHVLAALQSILVYWTSGLGGSLGPVIGPFRP